MVAETKMTGNGRTYESSETTQRAGSLAHDIISLLELQTKLFVADCKESVWRMAVAAGSFFAGLLVLFGAIPLILAAFAQFLVSVVGIPIGWSLLLSAILGILIAISLGALAWWSLRRAGRVFLRSGKEFTRNLGWLKESLKPAEKSREEREEAEIYPKF